MTRRKPTHESVSGTTKGTFVGWMSEFPEEIPVYISNAIHGLGAENGPGDIDTFYRIYPIPEGATGPNQGDPKEWIQAAGTAERLTVEVKRREADGTYRQYTVGRPSAAGEPAESELILIGDKNELPVRPSEVLTAADAIGIFQHYYDHQTIPEGWHLRELPEYADTSERNTGATASASASNGSRSAPVAVAGHADAVASGKLSKTEEQDGQQRRGDRS